MKPFTFVAGAAIALSVGASCRSAEVDAAGLVSELRRDEAAARLLADPEAHRIQILVSEVVPSTAGDVLRRTGYRLSEEYFYPASAIKLCGAIAAMEFVNEVGRKLEEAGASTPSIHSSLRFHPLFDDEVLEETDDTNVESGSITVAHEARKLFLVSDNRAYNRLFELAGHEYTNLSMHDAGLTTTRCVHRLSEFRSFEDNLRSPAIDIVLEDGSELTMSERVSGTPLDSSHLTRLDVGEAHLSGEELVQAPMNFARKNSISIRDLQDALVKFVRPDIDLGTPGFDLTDEQRELAMDAMSRFPGDSDNLLYDRETYPDHWAKWLLPGIERVVSLDEVTVYNKAGRAYGFSTENAYVVHEPSGRSYFLTAVVYTNPNQTVNDGVYGYSYLAGPFFAALGEATARLFLD